MSSAANHRKRSHRSETLKGAAFRAQSRRAFYRTATDRNNRGILGRLATMFHRKAPKQAPSREVVI